MAGKPLDEVDTAPDPEEDDLDDLDDVLDQFTTSHISPPAPAPPNTAAAPQHSAHNTPHPIPPSDFAAQLQSDMASLLGSLDSTPAMQQQLGALLQDLAAAEGGEATLPEQASAPAPPLPAEQDFSATIRATLARMQASGTAASAGAASAPSAEEEDLLAQMLAGLQANSSSSGVGGEAGEEEEGDFNALLASMMAQLTNKDILYEPMKELHDKFPAWMAGHAADATAPEELSRYREQQRLVGEIVGRFERGGYSDGNAADREFIVERMQKMQAAGSPPAELVGDMGAAQEALGDLEGGCRTQ